MFSVGARTLGSSQKSTEYFLFNTPKLLPPVIDGVLTTMLHLDQKQLRMAPKDW